ncbi:MAG: DUF11 domain-containing protein [Rhizobiales bacterium]|nr:DUF11 domain-containing protein [Hyphomicrobiales bacterium]
MQLRRMTRARTGLAVIALVLMGSTALAAPPPADTIIGNQALATYQNSAGETVTVRSNLVETIVNQVAGVDVATDTTKSGSPGGKVYYPHTISNDGNGPDIFDLTAVDANTGTIDPIIRIYPDADKDGVPDTLTPITITPSLDPGDVFGIVIEVELPATAAPGDTETVTVTATSQHDNTVSDIVTDTLGVTTSGIIELTKSMTPSNAAIGDTVTVTLTYANVGLASATNVVLLDTLPAELSYTPGSATWSDGGTLDDPADGTDGTNGLGQTIAYDFGATSAATVTATISSVPAGRTGTLRFTAVVVAGAAGTIENTAASTINGGPPVESNISVIAVDDLIAVSLADRSANAAAADPEGANLGTALVSSTDTDGLGNDVVSEDGSGGPIVGGGFPQGAVVPFEFVLTNHSNVLETFNLSVDNVPGNAYPAGTTFTLTDAAGVPLTDSDGDGRPDLVLSPDNLATPGAEHLGTVFLRVDLPNDASSIRAATDPAWQARVVATASSDPSVSNGATASLEADVIGETVDIENAGNLADGPAVDNAGNPWTTVTLDPGATAVFPIVVENSGAGASSYDLAFSGSNFAPGAGLPADFQVRFLNAANVEVNNTGLIAAGGSANFTAEVRVPATASPGNVDIYFRAFSPTNGSLDIKLDRVVVNEIVDLSIQVPQTTQAAPGGVIVMPHVITNEGNVTITEGALSVSGNTLMSATLFYDANNNGQLDPTDPPIDNIDDIPGGIAPGQSVTIFNRTQVPATAAPGLVEIGTVAISTSLNGGTVSDADPADGSLRDTVQIVSGDVELLKEQALDPNCTGAIGGYQLTQLTADPGQCIRYRVTATNTGTADATSVEITDRVPVYTTFENCGGGCAASARNGAGASVAPSTPADEATGQLSVAIGTLTPGQFGRLEFHVQIDN